MKRVFTAISTSLIGLSLSACSTSVITTPDSDSSQLTSSGTIIISGVIPPKSASLNGTATQVAENKTRTFAPLLGYARSQISYTPASNEYSLEISRNSSSISVKLGEKTIEEFKVDGALYIDAGKYVLERKESNPSWYAPDEYFSSRDLSVPFVGDATRFRRGALGSLALFSSNGLTIHSSPVWTPEVGGIRVDDERLNSLADNLSAGTIISVK